MTTAKAGLISFYLTGTGEAVIDWGDGSTPETITLSMLDENGRLSGSDQYTHTFSDTASRTIVIDGQNITHIIVQACN